MSARDVTPPPAPPPPALYTADREALTTFVDALFRYADEGTFVSWRAFREDVKNAPPVFIESSPITADRAALVTTAAQYATRAAQAASPAVFCPPLVTLASPTRAREVDLANGLALSVECDSRPTTARATLERLLGPATVVVASGGVWVDPETTAAHDKLHLHWRLTEPTTDPESHARLKRARTLATALVGGDATNTPAVHPIRWPGSWHRKGAPRLARIVGGAGEREIELGDALAVLETAFAGAGRAVREPGVREPGSGAAGSDFQPLTSEIATTATLVEQILTGQAMHAPLCALAYRYVRGGMAPEQAVLTLRGIMDAVPAAARAAPDSPHRWEGHYRDIPRAVRTAAEKLGEVATPPPVRDDVRAFSATVSPPRVALLETGERAVAEPPPSLLAPPGALGEIAAYGLASSVRPIPLFATQAALALGSVVCARRYVTSHRNYSSLYFLNVAKSGTGKEEAKTTIEAVLTAANARRLLGGSTYSSGNAVYSALLRKPQHLAILDEFGRYMDAAAASRDNYRAEALTMLMEAFGRTHADMSTPQFSTMTMRAQHAAEVEPKVIARPAISVLALTTPASFYGALTSTRVLDGFLNRFLIAEHTGPRQLTRAWADVPVPPGAVAWVQQVLAPRGDLDDLFRLDHLPEPTLVPFAADAVPLSAAFERDMLQLADRLERSGLGDMPIRTREIGLRVALIAALADTPDTPVITTDVLAWAFDYVRFFLTQTVAALRDRLADSDSERHRNTIAALVRAAGVRGVTAKELHKKPFLGIPKRDRFEAIESLLMAEEVAWVDVPQEPGKAGRPRHALVAIAADPISDDFDNSDNSARGVHARPSAA